MFTFEQRLLLIWMARMLVAYQRRAEEMQHKGLRDKFLTFKKTMDAIESTLNNGNEVGPVVHSGLVGMATQMTEMHDDLKFMAGQMGNSQGQSDGSEKEKQKEQPIFMASEVSKLLGNGNTAVAESQKLNGADAAPLSTGLSSGAELRQTESP
jgi:hypothetical protein